MFTRLSVCGVFLDYCTGLFGPNTSEWLNGDRFDEIIRTCNLEVKQEPYGKVCDVYGTRVLFKPGWCLVLSKHSNDGMVAISIHQINDGQISLVLASTLDSGPVMETIHDVSKPQGRENVKSTLEIISK